MEDLQTVQKEYTDRLAQAADNLLKVVEKALGDPEQFNLAPRAGTEGQPIPKLDTKALKDVTAVFKEVSAMVRELHGMDGKQEETLKVVFAAGDEAWNE